MNPYPIHHTFAPHVDVRYALRAASLLARPWTWHGDRGAIRLERALSGAFNADASVFASGRESLVALLKAMKLASGEEVIVQGYTCVVLANAIHAAGGVPVYCDIERDTLNLDCTEVEKHITPRTRAIICQHTFGITADTRRIRAICDAHDLLMIEDCAHVIPDATGPRDIATRGDAILLSFGRDKALSGVGGGAIVVRDTSLSHNVWALRQDARTPSRRSTVSLLLYPLAYTAARPVFGWGIGKLLLRSLRMLGLLPPVLTREERGGNMPPTLRRMPNACAILALAQWKKLEQINDHRRRLVRFYMEWCARKHITPLSSVSADLPLQKFPLFVRNASEVRAALKKENIHLDDGWTGCVVCPAGTDQEAANYHAGAGPCAEKACEAILSLPTHPTMTRRQAKRLTERLETFL